MMVFIGLALFFISVYTVRYCSIDHHHRTVPDYIRAITLICGYAFFIVGMVDWIADFFI